MNDLTKPASLPKYPKLLKEINDMKVAIKIFHLSNHENAYDLLVNANGKSEPTWNDMVELLGECYKVIDDIHYSIQRKY